MLAWPSSAYAYVDPVAGSMLLQLLLGGIAGLLVFARLFKQRFLRFFGREKDGESK
jgi:hypothetical protein